MKSKTKQKLYSFYQNIKFCRVVDGYYIGERTRAQSSCSLLTKKTIFVISYPEIWWFNTDVKLPDPVVWFIEKIIN